MDDLVEQGSGDRDPPGWARAVLVIALVLGTGLVLSRTQLLSADAPSRAVPSSVPSPGPLVGATDRAGGDAAVGVTVRRGSRLERYEPSGRRLLTRLPPGLSQGRPFRHVARPDGSGPLLGTNQTVLFRVDPVHPGPLRAIGRADMVIAASPRPGAVFVQQPFGGSSNGRRVAEVDTSTGRLRDGTPFPGFLGESDWEPVDVVAVGQHSALLLLRPYGEGTFELAVAWDRATLRGEPGRLLRRIGVFTALIGVAGARIVAVPEKRGCPRGGCPVDVVSVTVDRDLVRPVQPPPGWAFGRQFAGGAEGDPLILVARVGDPETLAFARMVAGGRSALLVPGSVGAVASVAPVSATDGSVVFAMRGADVTPASAHLAFWSPLSPEAAVTLDLPALEDGAQLVCACR